MNTSTARPKSRKDIGEWRTFFRWLLLKPYGNDLIAPQTRMWLLLARLVVATMAAAESTAWSYIAYNIANDVMQRAVAGIVGAVVFFIIAAIDTTFLTHDISGKRYEIAPDSEASGRWRSLKRIFSGTS